ncbi:MAG: RluA family pseudouridine synthase [Verrucomicrobiales bacterium]|nr:RluA family pseudouridine synthase [Verrucomicrobiales bacterium]
MLAEASDYVVVNKPSHLLVHPSVPGNPPTLWDGLKGYLAFEIANGGQVSIITRLDRETSGIVLVATKRESARRFGLAMQVKKFTKIYQALVWGWPEADRFMIDSPLRRKGEICDSSVWVKQMPHPDGKAARTHFRVLQRFTHHSSNGEHFSLIECRPHTGRMHQIRVHLQQAGHPIVGDKLYGKPGEQCYLDFIETGWTADLEKKLLLNRQALHASELSWQDELGQHHWTCPLPPVLQNFIKNNDPASLI